MATPVLSDSVQWFSAVNGKPNPLEYNTPNNVDEAVIIDIAGSLKSQ